MATQVQRTSPSEYLNIKVPVNDNTKDTTTNKVETIAQKPLTEIKKLPGYLKLDKSSNRWTIAELFFMFIAIISMLSAMVIGMSLLLISITFFSSLISMAFKSKAESIVKEINKLVSRNDCTS